MTRKKRPSKADKSDQPQRQPADAGEDAVGDAGDLRAKAEEPAKKVSLPAFGFAEDLLRKPARSRSGDPARSRSGDPARSRSGDPARSRSGDPARSRSGDAAEAEAAVPKPEIADTDPRRIFAFADSLDRNTAEAETEAVPVRLETWVAFSLAGEVFALPVAPIREVVRVASITRVPHAPKPIRGVTNRRGRVIPVIDLRLRIELPATELTRASRIIVVSSRRRLLGLLVHAVHQVVHIDREKVQPPPDDVMTIQSDYLSGVYHLDDQLILLLDIDRALIIQQSAEVGSAGVAPVDSEMSVEPPAGPAA